VTLFQRACDAGNTPGCNDLGLAYAQGRGVPKDEKRAADLYQQACDKGGPNACLNLGLMYARGGAVTRDETRAATLFQRVGPMVEARALLSSAKEADVRLAATYEVEGMAFDRENKRVEAQQAYAKAVDLNSANFYAYLRLANLVQGASTVGQRAETNATAQKLLAKSIALNDAFAPSFSLLANVLLQINQPQNAIGLAVRAASLEPGRFSDQSLVARVFARMSKREDAQAAAQQAMELARTDQERQSVKTLLDSLTRGGAGAAGGVVGGAVVGAVGGIGAPPPPPPPPGAPVRIGGGIKAPIRIKNVDAVYPATVNFTLQ
jgi:tetratricopeptide (TPR) repeat protein